MDGPYVWIQFACHQFTSIPAFIDSARSSYLDPLRFATFEASTFEPEWNALSHGYG